METVTLPAQRSSLEAFYSFVLQKAGSAGASRELLSDIRLGLEEILANVIFHAYGEQEGDVEVGFSVGPDGELSIRIRDWGPPFDPTTLGSPDLTQDVLQRKIGGMGIHLAREVSDRMVYERSGDANHLTICFHLKKA